MPVSLLKSTTRLFPLLLAASFPLDAGEKVFEYTFDQDPTTQDLDNNGVPDFGTNQLQTKDGALIPDQTASSSYKALSTEDSLFPAHAETQNLWQANFADKDEYTIEFTLKLEENRRGNYGTFAVFFQHPSRDVPGLYMCIDFYQVHFFTRSGGGEIISIPHDNTNGSHTYSISRNAEKQFTIKIDGVTVYQGTDIGTYDDHRLLHDTNSGFYLGDIWSTGLDGGFSLESLKFTLPENN